MMKIFARRARTLLLALCLGPLMNTLQLPARAELPPTAYRQMQSHAPEFLSIEVQRVALRPVTDGQVVDVAARVTVVKRTATHLLAGKIIHLSYFHHTKLVAGPSAIPVLETGKLYPAFLQKVVGQNIYRPVAGGYSFSLLD